MSCLAMPKSSTLTKSASPSRETRKMFSGLRSRWMMPAACAAESARQICVPMATTRSGAMRALVAQHLAEVEAVEALHDEVDVAVGRGARVGDVDDVGVADLGRGARLAAEARHQVRLPRELRVQDLERDLLADLDVLGLVDGAHAAGAEHALDAIAPVDDHADQRLRCRHFAGVRATRRRRCARAVRRRASGPPASARCRGADG